MLELTAENYHGHQANLDYLSASQLKAFLSCEAAAHAEICGAYSRPDTAATLVGGYVDAYFAHTREAFIQEHPEIFKRDMTLKSEYGQAERIIERIREAPLLAAMLSGVPQPIFFGEIDGLPFKGKFDSLLSAAQCAQICDRWPAMSEQLLMADGAIVDLKVMKDLGAVYRPGQGRMSFVEVWRYDLQLAVYQRLEGHRLPCFIAAASKEPVTDLRLIHLPQYQLDSAWAAALPFARRAQAIKAGDARPERCESCDWCRATRLIESAMDFEDLEGACA